MRGKTKHTGQKKYECFVCPSPSVFCLSVFVRVFSSVFVRACLSESVCVFVCPLI
ncbi:unnamed protein product [Meloidogyne enterolobii]|uniref:Uncharacterized protein n=1 Tax=Meloidogyne enterolobii TaxID=390850 RepID=A0ACB1A4D8_MELEN